MLTLRYDDIKYFHDIPAPGEGGSGLIIKEETPDPMEWWEEYQAYLEEKKANKNKSAHQVKYGNILADDFCLKIIFSAY